MFVGHHTHQSIDWTEDASEEQAGRWFCYRRPVLQEADVREDHFFFLAQKTISSSLRK
jgi:hypothetical protein